MDDTDTGQTPEDVLWTAVGVEAGLGVLALLLGWWIGPDARFLLPPAISEAIPAIVGGIALGVLAVLPLLTAIAIIRRVKHPAVEELETLGDHPMIRTMLRLSPGELLAISLCAGVGEELLFRGWLLPLLAGGDGNWLPVSTWESPVAWWGMGGWLGTLASESQWVSFGAWWATHGNFEIVGAIVVSSALFGFFHPITKLYIAITAVMGCYFALLLVLTGNLLVPIVAHGLYDAIQLWMASAQANREAADTGREHD